LPYKGLKPGVYCNLSDPDNNTKKRKQSRFFTGCGENIEKKSSKMK
jgi:hypothetical protein